MHYKVCVGYDLRKHYFTNRVTSIQNSVLNYVITADTANMFKIDWINYGIIKIELSLIIGQKLLELEAEVINWIKAYLSS